MKTLTQIQDEYISRVNAARLNSRKHVGLVRATAARSAEKQLMAWGFSLQQSRDIVSDAYDMAVLIWAAQRS